MLRNIHFTMFMSKNSSVGSAIFATSSNDLEIMANNVIFFLTFYLEIISVIEKL